MAEIQEPIRIGDRLTNLIDTDTNLSVNYTKIETLPWGGQVTDTDADGTFIRKAGTEYFRLSVDSNIAYKATMDEIRNSFGIIPWIFSTVFTADAGMEGEWKVDLSDTTSADNTGTVLVTDRGVRLKRVHSGYVDVRWFGAKLDYDSSTGTGTDDTAAWQRAIDYQTQRSLKIVFPEGRSYVLSTINLNTWTHIEGQGCLKSEFVAGFEGNVLQYLNGYVRDPDTQSIVDFGSSCQCQLKNFGMTNNIPKTSDSFGRLTSFCMGTAIHIEGLRYMGLLNNIRIIGGFNRAIYLFAPWGSTVDLVEVNRANYGMFIEAAANAMTINRFFAKNTGNVNSSNYGTGGGIYWNGGTNGSVQNSIIENANTSSPAITCLGNRNASVRNCYFERQTTATRSLIISSCTMCVVDNCTFENTYGIEVRNSSNVKLSNINVFDSDQSYTQSLAIRIATIAPNNCEFVEMENCRLNGQVMRDFTVTEKSTYMSITKGQSENTIVRPPYLGVNRFPDPQFDRGISGTTTAGVTASFIGAGMQLSFSPLGPSVMNTSYNNLYTHNQPTGGALNLFVRVMAHTGVTPKYIAIFPNSGTTVSRELPLAPLFGGWWFTRIPNAQNGVTYGVRIGITAIPPEEETITISDVYFGFDDVKSLHSVPAAASANTAQVAPSAYSQSQLQGVIDELRDLKAKMRTAGLLAT